MQVILLHNKRIDNLDLILIVIYIYYMCVYIILFLDNLLINENKL